MNLIKSAIQNDEIHTFSYEKIISIVRGKAETLKKFECLAYLHTVDISFSIVSEKNHERKNYQDPFESDKIIKS